LIVDTSVFVAIIFGEPGWEALRNALGHGTWRIPAPVLTELQLVIGRSVPEDRERARQLVAGMVGAGYEITAFTGRHAELTDFARERFGKGNGKGGLLNFGDLMVYAVAKERGEAVLCTGRDFATTDIEIHPASRLAP
jgi:ribonuclease VapC